MTRRSYSEVRSLGLAGLRFGCPTWGRVSWTSVRLSQPKLMVAVAHPSGCEAMRALYVLIALVLVTVSEYRG
jgi:hypothetical protein